MIFFRDQPTGYEGHVKLAGLFGELMTEVGHDPERPALLVMKAEGGKKGDAAGQWHSDGTWAKEPPLVSVLRCVVASPLGSDTCFSSAAAAYKALPEDVRKRIAPLYARASIVHGTRIVSATVDRERLEAALKAYPPVNHPIVRTHPITGIPTLYVNENHTEAIVGLESEEGQRLLSYLTYQFTRLEYQVAWKWTNNAFAVWDNAAVQHYAVPDQTGFRHVERIRVKGTGASWHRRSCLSHTYKPRMAVAYG